MLFFKTEEKHWIILKTFLLFLNYMPDVIYDIHYENNHIHSDRIDVDIHIVKLLRDL
jgi:hypothetical protein